MTTLDPAPGISSVLVIGSQTYTNVFALEHSQSVERVDTTGMGQLDEAFIAGRRSTLEITLRFYGTQTSSGNQASSTDAVHNLDVRSELPAGYVQWASGLRISWDEDFAIVTAHSSTAGTEGAVEHEVTLSLQAYTKAYV